MNGSRVVGGSLLIAVLFVVCAALAPGAAAQDVERKAEPIKIGCIFAITGPASFLGEPEANTVRMIAEQVNAKGGIGGRPIELLIEDTQGDETRAVNAVKDLIRKGVVAIIGPSRSGPSLAVKDIFEQLEVPQISCAAAEQITTPVAKWVFKTPQKDSHAVDRIYGYMAAHEMKRAGIISSTDGFGAAGREQMLAKAAAYGIEIVADETYGPGDTDMTAQLTKIKAAKVDAIINWSIVPGQSIVMKNAKQLEIKAQLFQSHGFGNIKFVQAAGDAAEGVIFPASRLLVVDELLYGHPHRAMLAEYKTQYESKFGTDASTFGGHANDALWLVLEACQMQGATRADIRNYIESRQGFLGTGGLFNFSPEDHTGLDKDAFEMLSVRDGRFVLAPR